MLKPPKTAPKVAGPSAPSTKLYTPQLLALSTQLANFPLSGSFDYKSEARSSTCGSTVELGVSLDSEGRVARLGMQLAACAVGQSSAAVMAAEAGGRMYAEFSVELTAIEAWLHGEAGLPQWPGFDALEAALPYPGRHGALLLPWKAMQRALSSAQS